MSKFHPLTIADVRHETRDTIAVTFTVPAELRDSFRFQQGQHLTLRAHIGDDDVRRSYSICSAVQDNSLRVAIKRTPGGLFSSWANDTLCPGHTIDVMPPMGHFNVPLNPEHRTTWHSPPAAALPPSCPSSRPRWRPNRTAASHWSTATARHPR
jgi:ring-1,2-phenylacetyl-CoA epoxidase subunit PaaE